MAKTALYMRNYRAQKKAQQAAQNQQPTPAPTPQPAQRNPQMPPQPTQAQIDQDNQDLIDSLTEQQLQALLQQIMASPNPDVKLMQMIQDKLDEFEAARQAQAAAQAQQQPPTPPPAPAKPANTKPDFDNMTFKSMSDQDYQDLYNNLSPMYKTTGNVDDARRQYYSNVPGAQGYTKSQWLNYKLKHGQPLNANEKMMDKNLTRGMRPIGQPVTLQRATHDGILKDLGIQNYQRMSDQQLNAALKGATWQSKAYDSCSTNASANPFIGGQASGGREIFLNISASPQTKMILGKGSQTEVILGKGTHYEITGVRYDNTTAYTRSGQTKKRLIIDVRTW